jgi:O-antigen/teichoic acid export membrane protein
MKKDVLSSYTLQILNIGIRFFLIPIYLNYLGLSAYGVIAFYFSIESIMVLLDFGIGLNAAKTIAELKIQNNENVDFSIIRLAEVLYLFIAFVIGGVIFLLNETIAKGWLTIDDDSINKVRIIKLMALLMFISWPKSFYENLLIGLRKIALKNIINIIFLIIRSAVLFFVITKVSQSLDDYFLILIIAFLLEVLALRFFSLKELNIKFELPSRQLISVFFKGAGNISLFSILSLFLFQIDKVVLSRFTTTSELGEYGLSGVLPLALLSLVYPVSSAAFPRLVKIEKNEYAKSIFVNWSFLLFSISLGFSVVLSLNYDFVISIWLKEGTVINNSISYLMLIGVVFHVITLFCTNLFITNGRKNLVNISYACAVFIFLITIFALPSAVNFKVAVGWAISNFTLFLLLSFFLSREFNFLFTTFYSDLIKLGLFYSLIFLLFFFSNRLNFLNGLVLLIVSCLSILFLFIYFFRNKLIFLIKET